MSQSDTIEIRPTPVPISTRAAPPRPKRLSRRALATIAGVSALGVATALGVALTSAHHAVPPEPVAVKRHATADILAGAPQDYSSPAVQRAAAIGPPPTGTVSDQSAPITQTGPTQSSARGGSDRNGAAAVAQRHRQQRESAYASKLFASGGDRGQPAPDNERTASSTDGGTTIMAPPAPSTIASPADPQDRKTAFVASASRTPNANPARLTGPAGRYVVTAGSTIAAALITGLSSDLPGEVVAQVTEDVFDSTTGRTRLIPQGSRLIGTYDAHVTYGQSRALVVWTRLLLPDGRSLDLGRLTGTDAAGQSGFADRVNPHLGKLIEAGLLSTLFGAGTSIATSGGGTNNNIAFAIRDSAGQSGERAGEKIVGRQLDVQPTITIRPGARVRVLVSRDLVLEPWTDASR